MEKAQAQNELRFEMLCGKCWNNVSKCGQPGKVLSCCDFLCYDCGTGIQEPFQCPSCRKHNVKFVSIDDPSIPREVADNIADPEECMESMKSVLQFQIKHYKTMMNRAVQKMMRDKKEFQRRLSLMGGSESGGSGGEHQLTSGQQKRPIPPYQKRPSQAPEGAELGERSQKIARPSTGSRPSTASDRPYAPSSSSGVWRTGNPSINSNTESNSIRNANPGVNMQQESRGDVDKKRQQMPENRQQMTPQQHQTQWKPVTVSRDAQQHDRPPPTPPNRSGQGLSLNSLLDGNVSDPQSSRRLRSGDVPPEQQYQQGQRHEEGQPFATPNQIGRRPTPSSPSNPRPPSAYGNRPMTPSAQFSQPSQLQQQQQRNQGNQRPSSHQGYPQRPNTTGGSAGGNRIRSPHGQMPVKPRTPNSMINPSTVVTVQR